VSGFIAQNWGNLASVAGLGISVWVLVVAKKAKRAAEEARSAARLKSLTEVLEEAANKTLQVGIFLRGQKWDIVHLRAEEVSGSCRLVLGRWDDHLTEPAKNDLIDAIASVDSIAGVAADSSMRQLTTEDLERALYAQVEAVGLISSVLGRARKAEERSKT